MAERAARARQADPSAAEEAWSVLLSVFGQQRRRFLIAASALDLHPAQAGALMNLLPGVTLPMHELAAALGCDTSNVTGLIDRLEARGLVQRQPSTHDRRVKHLVLTRQGASVRASLARQIGGAPEALERLSDVEQRQLRDLLRRAFGPD